MNYNQKVQVKLGIFVLFWIFFFCVLFCCSCIPGEQLTQPEFMDGEIIKVEKKTVWTKNAFGYEIPHRIAKEDTTNYVVGGSLIYSRP